MTRTSRLRKGAGKEDVDATFWATHAGNRRVGADKGTSRWRDLVLEPKRRGTPWYHVLVDGAERTTYVAERHLESDAQPR